MIRMDNVLKQYDNFRLECSMQVPVGQVTGLIGRNGAGKSTAFKAILGLIHTDGGTVEVFGKDVAELTQADREKIGVVLSDSGLCSWFTIRDFIPVLDTMYADFSRATKKESFGYSCLTNQRQFYQDNYSSVVIEKGSIDEVITMLAKRRLGGKVDE